MIGAGPQSVLQEIMMKRLRLLFMFALLFAVVPSAHPSNNMYCSSKGVNQYVGKIPYCVYSNIFSECMVCTVEAEAP